MRGLHGLRGAVRIEPLSDAPERFKVGRQVYVEGSATPLTLGWVRRADPGLLVRFREVTTREEAEPLRDAYLEAVVLPGDLPEGAYYWHEVLGARVRTEAGEELGSVVDIFRAGGGEVYVVRGGARGEVLVPAVAAMIRQFAPLEGRIIVDAEALGLGPPTTRRPRGRLSSKRAGAGPREESPGEAGPREEGPRIEPA